MRADAGLADIGIAPCEQAIGRMMTCPNLAEEVKRQMPAVLDNLRGLAKDPANRERVGAICIEMANAIADQLIPLGC